MRSDQAGDEGRAPSAVARLLVDEAVKNSADAGDAASEQHEEYSRKPDQRTADCRGDRSEIGHALPRNRVAVLSGQLLLPEIRSALRYRVTGPLAFFQASIPASI